MTSINNHFKAFNDQVQEKFKPAKEFFESRDFKRVTGEVLMILGALSFLAVLPLAFYTAIQIKGDAFIGVAVGGTFFALATFFLGKFLKESAEPPMLMGWTAGGR